jgi:anaerobic magnesium-protoporphyrin IX monomethyl ester cyclase
MDRTIALIALHAGYSHSSLALRTIAAFCRDQPFYPRIRIHETLVKTDLTWLTGRIVAERPGIVGLSTYLWNIHESLHLAAVLEHLVPDLRIVLGGPEAGPRAEALLRAHPFIDWIVRGEGEQAFCDLVRLHWLGEGPIGSIPGLAWRDAHGEVRLNPVEPVPLAPWRSPLVTGLAALDKPLLYWETARGCPYRCAFCTSATEELRPLPWSVIEADLAVLAGLRDKTVKVLDRSFHLGRRRTVALLQRLLETPASLRFHLELNPDRISDEALAVFARAPPGKFQFEVGLQTLDPPTLARIDRRMDVPEALSRVRQLIDLRRHRVHLDLIVGLPGEDAASCRASLDTSFRLHPAHLQLGTLKLLPGTPLRVRAQELGYRFDDQPPYEVLASDGLDYPALLTFKRYGELLERLWNHALVPNTLAYVVAAYFDARVSAFFDALLSSAQGRELAEARVSPGRVFAVITDFLGSELHSDTCLQSLLAWDYASHGLPGKATPAMLQALFAREPTHMVAESRRRLPVVVIDAPAASVINQRRLDALAPGRYAIWPQRHRKGVPVRLFRIG